MTGMSTAEILTQLPKLDAESRAEVLARLVELQDADLVAGRFVDEDEKRALDAAIDAYASDKMKGTPWREAIGQLRASRST